MSNPSCSFARYKSLRKLVYTVCWLLCSSLLVAGCQSTSGAGKQIVTAAKQTVLDNVLNIVGLQRAAHGRQQVTLQITGASSLNTMADGRSLPLLIRIYHLTNKDAFLTKNYHDFTVGDGRPEGADIAAMKEFILRPGQTYNTVETVQSESPYLGVVALYQQPSGHGWRVVLTRDDVGSEKTIKLIAGPRALSVTSTKKDYREAIPAIRR